MMVKFFRCNKDQDVGKSFGAPVFIAAALSYSLPETKKYATNKL